MEIGSFLAEMQRELGLASKSLVSCFTRLVCVHMDPKGQKKA